MTCRSNRKAASGFTLIEMVVATFLLAIGILGVMTAVSTGVRSTGLSEHIQTAAFLAQRKLSDIELNSDTLARSGGQQGDFGSDFPEYHWKSEVNPSEFSALYQVTVTVEWGEGPNARSRSIVTYLRDTSSQNSSSQSGGSSQGSTGASGSANGTQ